MRNGRKKAQEAQKKRRELTVSPSLFLPFEPFCGQMLFAAKRRRFEFSQRESPTGEADAPLHSSARLEMW
jgi:hypothetical protein